MLMLVDQVLIILHEQEIHFYRENVNENNHETLIENGDVFFLMMKKKMRMMNDDDDVQMVISNDDQYFLMMKKNDDVVGDEVSEILNETEI